MTENVRRAISDRTKIALADPERRRKISIGLKSVWSDPTKIETSRNLNCKAVQQLTLDGVVIATYRSAKEAQRITGINHGNMCSCARGKKPQAGGYRWRYVTIEENS